uniref:CFEM domain-containing protein n=1 Tax=Panagrellus redivivus TaxID=6233 RepID=A0A7E4W3B2_PANRE
MMDGRRNHYTCTGFAVLLQSANTSCDNLQTFEAAHIDHCPDLRCVCGFSEVKQWVNSCKDGHSLDRVNITYARSNPQLCVCFNWPVLVFLRTSLAIASDIL